MPSKNPITSDVPHSDSPTPPGGSGTILVVEDEDSLRDIIQIVLKSQGYRVYTASEGNQALELWKEQSANIDLLLTDLVMPGGISGQDLAKRLRNEIPDLKVVFTSGYSAEMAGKSVQLPPGTVFLQKPFLPEKLVQVVRSCLDGG